VREQKTQNQVSRRLLGLWVWGHDPWRWARKHDIVRMPPCPDVPWVGMTEKRKYGKVEVKMNPPTVFHGSSVAPEDMDGDFLMPGVSDDPDRASDEPIVSFTTWDTFAAYFAFVGRGLSEAQGTAKWPGGEDKIIVKADRPLLRKGYIYVADAKDIPGLQQHPERAFEYFTTEPVPLSIFEVYDLRREDWPQIVENPWFPSDTSYPSALTDQTISITQLSNPRTPEGKKFPQRYLTGLTPLERMIAEDEIDKGYEYDVNDPEAYEFWKSDIKATARGLKIGPSKHKEEYYRRYRKNIDKDYKPSGDSPKARFINRIAKETGIKRSLIEKVYDKGLAAWRVGHRPGVQQHQWAAGRVYAFAVGADSSTGPGKPDNKIAVEAGVR
jgi:hypothetical protein